MFLHHAYYAINNSIVLVLLAALIVHDKLIVDLWGDKDAGRLQQVSAIADGPE